MMFSRTNSHKWGPLYKPGEVRVGIGMEMAATVVAREDSRVDLIFKR